MTEAEDLARLKAIIPWRRPEPTLTAEDEQIVRAKIRRRYMREDRND